MQGAAIRPATARLGAPRDRGLVGMVLSVLICLSLLLVLFYEICLRYGRLSVRRCAWWRRRASIAVWRSNRH
jgi:hypothetical protein